MAKILTPCRYEPALRDMNEYPPGRVSHDLERTLTWPVGSVGETGKAASGRGKLLACTRQGAALQSHNGVGYQYQEKLSLWYFIGGEIKETVFSQVVECFTVMSFGLNMPPFVIWMSGTPGGVEINRYPAGLRCGELIRIRSLWMFFAGTVFDPSLVEVTGFYN